MEIEFWLIASVLVSVALLIIIPPIWKKKEFQFADTNETNIDIAREKLTELKALLKSGKINQNEYDNQLAELELSLNNDLSTTELPLSQKQGRGAVYVIILAIPIAAIWLYQSLGNPNALLTTAAKNTLNKNPHSKNINSVDTMLNGLVMRLNDNPDDLQGWLLLGKSYNFLSKFKEAEEAFAKAYNLADSNPKVMLQYADALVSSNNGSFAGKPKQLILKALELAPNNAMGLWLAGMLKAEEQDYEAAMNYWQRAEPLLEPGSKSYKKLKEMMANISESAPPEISTTVTLQQPSPSLELSEKFNPDSDNRQSWIEKGKVYKSEKQYQQAINAFAKADLLNSNQADPMLLYADALVMNDKGNYSKQAKALIFKALSISPNDTTGLWLAGKSKVQEGAFYEALGYLYRAKGTLSPDSNSYVILDEYIGKVTAHTTDNKAASSPIITKPKQNNAVEKALAPRLSVHVDLSDHLKSSVAPEDIVFIYAKADSGPQMPIAIVRKQAKDLPIQIDLTDAQAMTPMMKLSGFQRVNITARISKSGNAITQPGDFLGIANSIIVSDSTNVDIKIDQKFE